VHCPSLCLSRCPVSTATANLSFSPWGKQSAAWRVKTRLVESSAATQLPLWMCLDCLACREACLHGIDVPANLAAARIECAAGKPPMLERRQPGEWSEDKTAARIAPYDPEVGWKLLRDIAPSWRRVKECQALLVPGMELLQEDSVDLLEAVFRMLDVVGDKVLGINRDSALECGHHPFAHGWSKSAEKEARTAAKKFGRYSRVVFASPHCASFVRLRWPEAGLDRSRQATTLLEYAGRRLDLSGPAFHKGRVAWLDPCHLGRHLGLYQLPRDILKWACNHPPVELLHRKEKGQCCGGGWPVPSVAPEVASEVSSLVIEEFRASGAQTLLVGCAQCRRQLKTAAPGLPVRHIVELMAEKNP
jgi:Fe-S oxidoreductase